MTKSNRHIQSVERAMAILECLNSNPNGLSLATLCEICGLTKSTAHGLLRTLVDMGYASNIDNQYQLGARTLTLAPSQTRVNETIELFTPALHAFNDICQQHSYLAIPSGTRSFLIINSLDSHGRPVAATSDAQRDAVRTSAIGKIFMANDSTLVRQVRRNGPLSQSLENEIRLVGARGFAFDQGESCVGMHCLAIPLRYKGAFVGALAISGSADEMPSTWMLSTVKTVLAKLGSATSL